MDFKRNVCIVGDDWQLFGFSLLSELGASSNPLGYRSVWLLNAVFTI